ncbi:hypothetical protein [Nocardioides mangrovi]|uniref:Uncharacterized protein n=1 Tax=Nocardioides mangrovi TaxID=2874580 RepID=A0ABS7UJX3_9ACTN|nr:hypothetical protein [Nocardioides mangrovi]MBZ5741077.1 hypothetical protein [Nocardioides mangrovi]
MKQIRTTTAALASAFVLGIVAAPVAAQATTPDSEPCAAQQTKVDKATDALARVSAVFERQHERVADARHDVKHADSRSDRAAARAELAQATAKLDRVAKDKKAQQQRLAKAEDRLDACQAAQNDGGTPAA